MPITISGGVNVAGGTTLLPNFSPIQMFATNEPGVWYDPSDLSTMFQDSAGTTPVTATGQTVGLVLDKSGRGNHATQSNAANRPIYGIEPFGGRRNLLLYTEQFDNVYWGKDGVAAPTPNSTTAPNGTITADTLVASAGSNSYHRIFKYNTITSGAIQTFSVYLKQGTQNFAIIALSGNTTPGSYAALAVNLATGVITQTTTGPSATSVSSAITSAGNGWYRVSITAICGTDTSVGTDIRVSNTGTPTFGNYATYTWSAGGTESIYIWGAQVETGATATAYQQVTDQWNVTEAGVPSVSYLQFDGTDDWFVTPTITPNIDKAQVFAGVRKLSDTLAAIVVETGTSATASAGGLYISAPNSNGAASYSFLSRGSGSLASAVATSFSAPITSVITGLGDIAADISILRINSNQVASSATDQGTGNYLAYPIYIGRRAGTSLPFNGRIYQLIARFGNNLSNDSISQVENYVNSKTGAY